MFGPSLGMTGVSKQFANRDSTARKKLIFVDTHEQ